MIVKQKPDDIRGIHPVKNKKISVNFNLLFYANVQKIFMSKEKNSFKDEMVHVFNGCRMWRMLRDQ